jgi:hypothetical protein
MSKYGIKFMGVAGHEFETRTTITRWLKSADIEAEGGRGKVEWTAIPNFAKTFDSQGEAYAFWLQESKTVPTRPDGQPNKPLTAFTVEIGEM